MQRPLSFALADFKTLAADDILDVFLALDAFADTHKIGMENTPSGAFSYRTIPCVIQSPTEQKRFQATEKYDGFEVTHGELFILHAKKEDFGEAPVEGAAMTIDGVYCIVACSVEDMGMLSITLHNSHAQRGRGYVY